MKRFNEIIAEHQKAVDEIFPWDLEELMEQHPDMLLIDVREPYEFDAMHIEGSINVPRGILETACEYDYDETIPELAAGRDRNITVICRSGNRSILAAYVMQQMGFMKVRSMKTGLRGWNEFELPMISAQGAEIDVDDGDEYFTPKLRPEQLDPARR